MDDITSYFIDLLQHCRAVDVADAEFKRNIADDDDLRDAYREWCHENGHSEKNGFRDFCEEYIESQNSIWDSLNDYDNYDE